MNTYQAIFMKYMKHIKKEFETLLPTTIERIISNQSLKLKNEDQLFNFINELCLKQNENENENYSRFYGYVIFSNLSPESMETFINNFDYNEIDHETWTSLSNRLTKPILNQNENENAEQRRRYENTKIENENEKLKKNCEENFFSPQQENEFVGIINYLKSKGDISNQLEITASSIGSTSYPLKNVIDYQNRNYFCTQHEPGSWICFDFK